MAKEKKDQTTEKQRKKKNTMKRPEITEERVKHIDREYIDTLCARYDISTTKLGQDANVNYHVFYRFLNKKGKLSIAEKLKIERLVIERNFQNLHEHLSKKQVALIKEIILKK